jgi:isocitrate dehydrogenase
VLAGEKAFGETGDRLPQATVDAFDEYLIGIKGPTPLPWGNGVQRLNLAEKALEAGMFETR